MHTTPAASSFFSSTPPPASADPRNNVTPNFKRVQSTGSSHFAPQRSIASMSTMTNTMNPGAGSIASRVPSHGSVPTTIQVTNRNTRTSTSTPGSVNANANANPNNANAGASRFFSQNQPITTLNENRSMSMHSHGSASASANASNTGPQQSLNNPTGTYQEYQSPALTTAVNMFSKTASALYQTTSAAIDAAGDVGGKVEALRNDFVSMAAPMEAEGNASGGGGGGVGGPVTSSALFDRKDNKGGNILGISGAGAAVASSIPTSLPTSVSVPVPRAASTPSRVFVPSAGPGHGPGPLRVATASPIPPLASTNTNTAFTLFQNHGGANTNSMPPFPPSPARSAVELFGQSAASIRSASPGPMRALSPIPVPISAPTFGGVNVNVNANLPPSGIAIATASSLFGTNPPPSARAPSPVPVRAPSPIPTRRAPSPSPVLPPVKIYDSSPARSAADLFGQALPTGGNPPAIVAIESNSVFGQPPVSAVTTANTEEVHKPAPTMASNPPPTAVMMNQNQTTPARTAGSMFAQPAGKVNAPSPSHLFQKPPMPTHQKDSTPARKEEPEVKPVFTPVSSAPRSTPKSTPIQVKPLPKFNKPRFPSPLQRRPRVSATPERKALALPLPVKKPLPLPQPKKKSSFSASLLAKKDVINATSREDGMSVTSIGSGSARSGNSGAGGMFRMPPPIQISSSPKVRRGRNLTDITSPLKSPIFASNGLGDVKLASAQVESHDSNEATIKSSMDVTALNGVSSEENAVDKNVVPEEKPCTNEATQISSVALADKHEVDESKDDSKPPMIDQQEVLAALPPPPPPSALPPLPENWVELIAPDSGMKYYLNAATRVTTWERPVPPDFIPPLPPAPEECDSKPLVLNDEAPEGSEAEDVVSDLHESIVDTASEVLTQVHEETAHNVAQEFVTPIISNATELQINFPNPPPSLSVPEITTDNSTAMIGENQQVETAIPDDYVHVEGETGRLDQGASIETASSALPSANLPNSWVELVDQDTGATYFYSEEQNIASWERPNVPNDVVEDSLNQPQFQVSPESPNEEDAFVSEVEHDDHLIEPAANVESEIALPEERAQPTSSIELFPVQSTQEFPNTANHPEDTQEPISSPANELDTADGAANALPADWIEMTDENSGQSYYFNEQLGDTQWERPLLSLQTNEVEVAEVTGEEPATHIPIESTGETSMNIPASQGLTTDGEVSNETVELSIEPLQTESLDRANTEPKVESETVTESTPLPQGWITMVDESSNMTYYYNEAEGITQWEAPEISVDPITEANDKETPPEELDAQEERTAFDHDDVTEGIVSNQMESTAAEGTELQPIVTSDEAEITDKTPNQVAMTEGNVAYEKMPEEAADLPLGTEEADSTLPSGWVEMIDETSGQQYYYNEVKNITQWKKPKLPESVELPSSTAGLNQGVDETEVQPVVAPDEAELIDTTPNEVVMTEGIVANEKMPEEAEDLPLGTEEADSTLPSGWVEMIDETSGQQYYYNEVENITQWDKPKESRTDDDSVTEPMKSQTFDTALDAMSEVEDEFVDATVKKTVETNVLVAEEKPTLEVVADLPAGWVEMIDETSSLPYYFNEVENITQWEKPDQDEKEETTISDVSNSENLSGKGISSSSASDNAEPKDVPVQGSDKKEEASTRIVLTKNSLPAGWEELIDESSGQPYYFNEADNVTQWERPKQGKKSSDEIIQEPTEAEENTSTVVHESANDEKEYSTKLGVETEITPDDATSVLQPGWVEMFDESSGQPYYFNESKNVTQWVKPLVHKYNAVAKNDEGDLASSVNGAPNSQEEWVEVDVPSVDMPQKGSVATVNISKASVPSTANKNDLPSGWAEILDASSGKQYYVHAVKNITQWDRPVSFEAEDIAVTSIPRNKKQERCRPPHAIATFGFGGRLCVMRPQAADSLTFNLGDSNCVAPTLRKGPVELHRLSSLLPDDHLPRTNNDTSKSSLLRPFINCPDPEVLSYLEEKSGECQTDNELLWNLVSIAARWKGRLRSADGITNPDGPEATVVNLLLRSESIMANDSLVSHSFQGMDFVCISFLILLLS